MKHLFDVLRWLWFNRPGCVRRMSFRDWSTRPNEGTRMKHDNNAPPPIAANVEVIPFTMTIRGKMTVPAGTSREAVQAAVLGGVSLSAALASSGIEFINVDTAGLTIAK
jgi:hypothetical protein